MKRLFVVAAILFSLVLIPESAQAQFKIGARAKLLLPTGDFNKVATTGWGLAATGDFTIIPLLKLRGEIGYNQFDGEEHEGVTYDTWNIWNFLIGARLQLPIIYLSLDGAYFTEIDEFSVLPGLGLRFLFLDIGGRYKWTGENWFEIFGGVSF